MKKVILILAFVTISVTNANAQTTTDNREKLSLGVKVGANYSNVYDSDNKDFVALVIGLRTGWDVKDNDGEGNASTPRYKNMWHQLLLVTDFNSIEKRFQLETLFLYLADTNKFIPLLLHPHTFCFGRQK